MIGRAAPAPDEFRTPRPIAGWRVVATAFWMAVFAWGLGFYALSLYVHHLGAGGWPSTLLSAATTGYFLAGAASIHAVERAAARFGRRPVAIAGALLLAGGVAALPRAGSGPALAAAYGAMALGWAATSGTAISQVIGAWFDRRRGLALNLALTGASASGFLIVPPMAWCIARWGVADGLAGVAAVLAAVTVIAIATNLPEARPVAPADAAGAPATDAAAASANDSVGASVSDSARASATGPVRATGPDPSVPRAVPAAPEPLARVTTLFAIGWLAQVAFLAQQLPLLVPKVGVAQATAAVATTTAASLVGRLLLSTVIDRIDHRVATAGSFLVQAAGMALLLVWDAPVAVLAGCVLFGLSVGNVITLPAIFAQREFAAARYGPVVNRVWTLGQLTFALGPIGAGALIAATGGPAATIAACLGCQVAAAALCGRPGPRPGPTRSRPGL